MFLAQHLRKKKGLGVVGFDIYRLCFPEGCSILQLLGGVQSERLEWDPFLFCFINRHGEKSG